MTIANGRFVVKTVSWALVALVLLDIAALPVFAQGTATPLSAAIEASVNAPVANANRRLSVTIKWKTGDGSHGLVFVSRDGAPETVFAEGPSGSQVADWIVPESNYEFRLYSGSPARSLLASVTIARRGVDGLSVPDNVRAESAALSASPNPVPPGPGPGTTQISWDAGNVPAGRVAVSVDGNEETPFAGGARGSADAAWITHGHRYEFRLYGDAADRSPLRTLVVTRAQDNSGLVEAFIWLSLVLAGLVLVFVYRRRQGSAPPKHVPSETTPGEPQQRRTSTPVTAAVGTLAVGVFLLAATYRLDRAGLYYDELHQATGAFSYVGRPSGMFSLFTVGGVPLLNMSYSGAIKTAVYGLYLRSTGRPFSILSWRLLGVAFVGIGIVAFTLIAGSALGVPALVIFWSLLLTDLNVLLQSRYDWGPVALAFMLRLIFLAVWIDGASRQTARATNFVLGVLVGLSICEKLSSAVLLAPLAAIGWTTSVQSRRASMRSLLVGTMVGALPMIAIQGYALIAQRTLLALTQTSAQLHTLWEFAINYLILGGGSVERLVVLDVAASPWWDWPEGLAIGTLAMAVLWAAWRHNANDRRVQLAGIAMGSWLAIAVALRLLPSGTTENHWILGTPFQYVAIALFVAATSADGRRAVARRICLASVAVLLICRTPGLLSAFEAIRDDHYSADWDPSVNEAARFAASLPPDAVFIAADWGVAAEVLCLSNGRENFVFEPFWEYQGRETIAQLLDEPNRRLALVAAPRSTAPVAGLVTKQIFDDVAANPNWIETALDPRIASLRSVEIRSFRRIRPSGRSSVSAAQEP